jgi:hypothetical protein
MQRVLSKIPRLRNVDLGSFKPAIGQELLAIDGVTTVAPGDYAACIGRCIAAGLAASPLQACTGVSLLTNVAINNCEYRYDSLLSLPQMISNGPQAILAPNMNSNSYYLAALG